MFRGGGGGGGGLGFGGLRYQNMSISQKDFLYLNPRRM